MNSDNSEKEFKTEIDTKEKDMLNWKTDDTEGTDLKDYETEVPKDKFQSEMQKKILDYSKDTKKDQYKNVFSKEKDETGKNDNVPEKQEDYTDNSNDEVPIGKEGKTKKLRKASAILDKILKNANVLDNED